MTPLIDSLGKNKRFNAVAYMNHPGGSQLLSTAGVLATPVIGSSHQPQGSANGLPFLTPRTSALYASNERQFNSDQL